MESVYCYGADCLSLAAGNVNSHINVVLLKFDCGSGYIKNLVTKVFNLFHWCVQNAMIPCRSQELTFSCHPSPPTTLPSSLTSSCHLFLGLPLNLVVPKFIHNSLLVFGL